MVKEKEVAELLGIPADVTQCGLLPVAYTIGTEFKTRPAAGRGSIVHWNKW